MKRGAISWPKVVWLLLGALYFVAPLLATLQFSLETGGGGYGFDAYAAIFSDPLFYDSIWFSFKLAVATILLSTVLIVPTVYWVRLRLPRLRPVVEFISILPFVVPPIVLIVGLLSLYGSAPQWFAGTPLILLGGYVIHVLPYVYISANVGMQAIDIRTLTEASRSLGAGWSTVLLRVILPNIRAAVLSGAFITLAIVMGEYAMASLMLFNSFAVYINYVGQTQATPAAALTLISFAITWIAMLGLLALGRRGGRQQAHIGGAR